MPDSTYTVHERGGFRYIDEGAGPDVPPIVLLHGMLGDLSNWTRTIRALTERDYRVLVPVLPVYELPLTQTSVSGLTDYLQAFCQTLALEQAVLVGNSLGGHIALLYTLAHPSFVPALVLSGASGIYEVSIGTTVPRRNDRAFIRERAAVTFYDPDHVTEALVEEMHNIINDRSRALRLIKMARSAKSETVVAHLDRISTPTLLVWGRDDEITPPDVAEAFFKRMTNARLKFIDQCGHAPMIEHPETFNALMLDFLHETVGTPALNSGP